MAGNLSYFAKKESHQKFFVQFNFELVELVLERFDNAVSNSNGFWSNKSKNESDMDLCMVNSAINLVKAWKDQLSKTAGRMMIVF